VTYEDDVVAAKPKPAREADAPGFIPAMLIAIALQAMQIGCAVAAWVVPSWKDGLDMARFILSVASVVAVAAALLLAILRGGTRRTIWLSAITLVVAILTTILSGITAFGR
jgi:hypothetical protein